MGFAKNYYMELEESERKLATSKDDTTIIHYEDEDYILNIPKNKFYINNDEAISNEREMGIESITCIECDKLDELEDYIEYKLKREDFYDDEEEFEEYLNSIFKMKLVVKYISYPYSGDGDGDEYEYREYEQYLEEK